MGSRLVVVELIDGVGSSSGVLFVITVVGFLVVLYYYHCIHVCFCNTMIGTIALTFDAALFLSHITKHSSLSDLSRCSRAMVV